MLHISNKPVVMPEDSPQTQQVAGSHRERLINASEESARRGARRGLYRIQETAAVASRGLLFSLLAGMHFEFRIGKIPHRTRTMLYCSYFLVQVVNGPARVSVRESPWAASWTTRTSWQ